MGGDHKLGVKTYATSFGEKNAAKISFCMFFISGIFGILLFIGTILSPIFLMLFFVLWVYILYNSYAFAKVGKEDGGNCWRKGFNYLLLSYNLIFLDVLLQLVSHHFDIL